MNTDTPTETNPAPPAALLTDSEVIKALYAAGIPPLYHRKDLSLASLASDKWAEPQAAASWAKEEAKDFAALGKAIEIPFDGKPAYDFTYLLARSLQLRALPVSVVSLPLIASAVERRHEPEGAEQIEEWHQSKFLIVIGGTGTGPCPYQGRTQFEMEWFLRSWLLNGLSLIMQGPERMDVCEWWTYGLRSVFRERRALRFEGPPDVVKLPPAKPRLVRGIP